MKRKIIRVPQWPRQSSDLNQIERLLRHIQHLSSCDSLYRLQSKCKPNQEVKDKLKMYLSENKVPNKTTESWSPNHRLQAFTVASLN